MVTLKYAHLADYATIGANGKPIMVGVFDRVQHPNESRAIRLPDCYLLMRMTCSVADGTAHDLELQLRDGNGEFLGEPIRANGATFQASGPGYPLVGTLLLGIRGMPLPELGDYEFVLRVDGREVGALDFVVTDVGPT